MLKYNQGHWKLNELVKFIEYYHHAAVDIYHVYSVREDRNVNRPAG